jgi:lipopolysaccharide biosynthesis protein
MTAIMSPRSIAFFLPQFHPIPENDEWWGTGFTEWRNVARATPRFRGHYQPHLPADLGFYDLRLPEVRHLQADLAGRYGVDAFCYYHYWFSGRRVLERPVDDLLHLGEPDFPFMLCWANENWTRTWDGGDAHVLLEQKFLPGDAERFIRELLPVLADPRYVTIEGKPVLLVYSAARIPDVRRVTDTWREVVAREGLGELFLGRVESHPIDRDDPRPLGFDAGVEFSPDILVYPPRVQVPKVARAVRRVLRPDSGYRHNRVFDYDKLVANTMAKPDPGYPRFPCVMPGWDNSPRRETGAIIFRGSTPERYQAWLAEVVRDFQPPVQGGDLVFVNAWNEWAEGAHLEPDLRFGHRYLEAHAAGMRGIS